MRVQLPAARKMDGISCHTGTCNSMLRHGRSRGPSLYKPNADSARACRACACCVDQMLCPSKPERVRRHRTPVWCEDKTGGAAARLLPADPPPPMIGLVRFSPAGDNHQAPPARTRTAVVSRPNLRQLLAAGNCHLIQRGIPPRAPSLVQSAVFEYTSVDLRKATPYNTPEIT